MGGAEHAAVDEVERGAREHARGLVVAVADADEELVGVLEIHGGREVEGGGGVGAIVPADVATVDEDIGHTGGTFKDQEKTAVVVGGGDSECLAIPAGGVVGQAGLAEDVGNGNRRPRGLGRRNRPDGDR